LRQVQNFDLMSQEREDHEFECLLSNLQVTIGTLSRGLDHLRQLRLAEVDCLNGKRTFSRVTSGDSLQCASDSQSCLSHPLVSSCLTCDVGTQTDHPESNNAGAKREETIELLRLLCTSLGANLKVTPGLENTDMKRPCAPTCTSESVMENQHGSTCDIQEEVSPAPGRSSPEATVSTSGSFNARVNLLVKQGQPLPSASNSKGGLLTMHTFWTEDLGTSIKCTSVPLDQPAPSREISIRRGRGKSFELEDKALTEALRHMRNSNRPKLCCLCSRWPIMSRVSLIRSPTSTGRYIWDAGGLIIIGFDIIFIPLSVFDPPSTLFTVVMGWITIVYWSLDVGASLTTGYYHEGNLEMKPWMILRSYARTWMVFDLVVLVCDWISTIVPLLSSSSMSLEGLGVSRFLKSARFVRMTRLVRLLRLVKIHARVSEFLEQLQAESVRIVLGIVRLVIMIVLANHCIACGFYWIGTIGEHLLSTTWLQEYSMKSRSLSYRYTTSLHWSLTQFTPASMEIFPRNTMERTYTICALLLALITFSSFISSLTNAMTQLRNLNTETRAQQTLLQRYLTENHVSVDLASRVLGWLQANPTKVKKRLHEKDVPTLAMLPSTLKAELWEEVYMKALVDHPFFFQMREHWQSFTRKLNRCITEIFVRREKELFQAGDIADSMYFVVAGTLRYHRDAHYLFKSRHPELSLNPPARPSSLGKFEAAVSVVSHGQWLCEAVLWAVWRHAGSLFASTCADLFGIQGDKFRQLLRHHPELLCIARRYALLFSEHVNQSAGCTIDLADDFDVLQELAQRAFCGPAEEEVEEEGDELQKVEPDGMPTDDFAMVLPSSLD